MTTLLMAPGELDSLALLGPPRPAWMERGACLGTDTERFFPEGQGSKAGLAKAREVCAGCPVLDECLAFALKHGEQGVWGGTTTAERRAMREAMRRAA